MGLRSLLGALRSSPIEEVVIYNGLGATRGSADRVRDLLQKLELPWSIGYITTCDADRWVRGKTLFVLPGGKCSEWDPVLSQEAEKIKRFVHEGGFVLGICAGAYYMSAESCYQASPTQRLEFRRKLDFFPGRAEGPLFFNPAGDYGVSWEPKEVTFRFVDEEKEWPALVLGGPCFSFQEAPHTQVMAKMGEANLIVRSIYGAGFVVLTSWNPGNGISAAELEGLVRLFPKYNWGAMKASLDRSEKAGLYSLARILKSYQ